MASAAFSYYDFINVAKGMTSFTKQTNFTQSASVNSYKNIYVENFLIHNIQKYF